MNALRTLSLFTLALLAGTVAQADETVLKLDFSTETSAEYDSTPPASSGDPYGTIDFAYGFGTVDVAPDFDLYESYHWTVSGVLQVWIRIHPHW